MGHFGDVHWFIGFYVSFKGIHAERAKTLFYHEVLEGIRTDSDKKKGLVQLRLLGYMPVTALSHWFYGYFCLIPCWPSGEYAT